jgi:HJR/Mrr/RecB family endonuclease
MDTELELLRIDEEIKRVRRSIRRNRAQYASIRAKDYWLRIRSGWQGVRTVFPYAMQWLRTQHDLYGVPLACTLLVCAVLTGAIALVSAHLLSSAWQASIFISCAALTCTTTLLGYGLYFSPVVTSDPRFSWHRIDERLEEVDAERVATSFMLEELKLLRRQLRKARKLLKDKLRREIKSGVQRRRELLKYDWRILRGNDWELYLAEVFHALGGKATVIGCSGDQGCDLVVELGENCIAVQAKGYLDPVGNKAVQEAISGMVFHGCSCCAVITNSRFTGSAKELAARAGCALIDGDVFPEFVMGRAKLFI